MSFSGTPDATLNPHNRWESPDAASYQRLLELLDRLETVEAIRRGLEEMKTGKGRPADEVLEEIRKEYEIPRDS